MKIRYRTAQIRTGFFSWKEVLVLQVYKSYGEGPWDFNGIPEYLAGSDWFDATIEDLTVAANETL